LHFAEHQSKLASGEIEPTASDIAAMKHMARKASINAKNNNGGGGDRYAPLSSSNSVLLPSTSSSSSSSSAASKLALLASYVNSRNMSGQMGGQMSGVSVSGDDAMKFQNYQFK
jgi:hypothetical protein